MSQEVYVLDKDGFDALSRTWRRTDERDLSYPRHPWEEQVHPLGVPNNRIWVRVTGSKEPDGTSHEGLYPGKQVVRQVTHDPSITVGTGTPPNPPKWVDGENVWVNDVNDGDLDDTGVLRYYGEAVGYYDNKVLVLVGPGTVAGEEIEVVTNVACVDNEIFVTKATVLVVRVVEEP